MNIELKGLGAALIAGLLSVGACFGLASLVRSQMPTPKAPAHASAAHPAEALVVRGGPLYAHSCAVCHGAHGEGAQGPDLRSSSMSGAQITATITNGVKGAMPAFGAKYSAADIQAIAAYVQSLRR